MRISMTKKRIELTIDEDILEKAKKQIPNMSNFFQNCLEAYLGININSLFYTSDAQESIDIIKNAQTALYLLTERNDVEENIKQAERDEINLAWRKLYTEYRDQRTINKDYLKHASEILNVPGEELTDIVEVCYVYNRNDSVDVTDWSAVYEAYGYGDGHGGN